MMPARRMRVKAVSASGPQVSVAPIMPIVSGCEGKRACKPEDAAGARTKREHASRTMGALATKGPMLPEDVDGSVKSSR